MWTFLHCHVTRSRYYLRHSVEEMKSDLSIWIIRLLGWSHNLRIQRIWFRCDVNHCSLRSKLIYLIINDPSWYTDSRSAGQKIPNLITVFTRACHWTLLWVRRIQSNSHPNSRRYILILSPMYAYMSRGPFPSHFLAYTKTTSSVCIKIHLTFCSLRIYIKKYGPKKMTSLYEVRTFCLWYLSDWKHTTWAENKFMRCTKKGH
jgi:hypothetical protein